MNIFEILMLLCFGAAWPFSIAKSLKTRDTAGKSPIFLGVLFAGYIFGILYKFSANPDIVLALYILNFIMVGTELLLYVRNSRAATAA